MLQTRVAHLFLSHIFSPSHAHPLLTMTDPYTALGVTRSASSEEIKRAFRAAALESHPDRACGPGASPHVRAAASARFAALTAAYEVLGDGKGGARSCVCVLCLCVRALYCSGGRGAGRVSAVSPRVPLSRARPPALILSPFSSSPANKRRLFDLGGGHASTSTASSAYGSPTHNPFGGGWTRRRGPSSSRPPPRPPGWWAAAARTVLARSTKGDVLAHASMASLVLFGATAVAGLADAAWQAANEGKRFEDAVAAVAQEKRRRVERDRGESAEVTATATPAAPVSPADKDTPQPAAE